VTARELAPSATRGWDPEVESSRADERALTQADWLVRLATWVKEGILPATPDATVVQPSMDQPVHVATTAAHDFAIPPADSADSSRAGRWISVVQADLGAPLSLIVAAAVTYRMRQPLGKWWRRRSQGTGGWHRTNAPFGHRPHLDSTRTRARKRNRQSCSMS
jgi:hypothetical protein